MPRPLRQAGAAVALHLATGNISESKRFGRNAVTENRDVERLPSGTRRTAVLLGRRHGTVTENIGTDRLTVLGDGVHIQAGQTIPLGDDHHHRTESVYLATQVGGVLCMKGTNLEGMLYIIGNRARDGVALLI